MDCCLKVVIERLEGCKGSPFFFFLLSVVMIILFYGRGKLTGVLASFVFTFFARARAIAAGLSRGGLRDLGHFSTRVQVEKW